MLATRGKQTDFGMGDSLRPKPKLHGVRKMAFSPCGPNMAHMRCVCFHETCGTSVFFPLCCRCWRMAALCGKRGDLPKEYLDGHAPCNDTRTKDPEFPRPGCSLDSFALLAEPDDQPCSLRPGGHLVTGKDNFVARRGKRPFPFIHCDRHKAIHSIRQLLRIFVANL